MRSRAFPDPVMKLVPVAIRMSLVATVWQHGTSVSELHNSQRRE